VYGVDEMPWPKGKSPSPESREKNRLSQIGKKRSLQTREKQRLSALGRKHSPETIEKLKVSWKLRPAYRDGKRRNHATANTRSPRISIPAAMIDDYRLFLRKGFRKAEALQMLGLTNPG
jgi:hypothetical protein